MSPDGKVRVVVKSRRVPAGTFQLQRTLYTPTGIPMGTTTDRRLLYEYVLDEDNRMTIHEAHNLARRLCLDLEVVDSAKLDFFRRFLMSLGRRGPTNPAIEVLSPSSTTPSVPVQAPR